MHPLSDMYYTYNTLTLGYETLEYECRDQNKGTFKIWLVRNTVCGFDVQKVTKIVILQINVKLGFMHMLSGMYTHTTLSLGYETLEYECRQ